MVVSTPSRVTPRNRQSLRFKTSGYRERCWRTLLTSGSVDEEKKNSRILRPPIMSKDRPPELVLAFCMKGGMGSPVSAVVQDMRALGKGQIWRACPREELIARCICLYNSHKREREGLCESCKS
ncbi:hypothetical protein GFGA_1c1483 [Gluconobacter frateurii NBRC 103465]|nr:hypothetical protein GFGA_1c1483 [Gluconobacter frateurii NBRC 103465]